MFIFLFNFKKITTVIKKSINSLCNKGKGLAFAQKHHINKTSKKPFILHSLFSFSTPRLSSFSRLCSGMHWLVWVSTKASLIRLLFFFFNFNLLVLIFSLIQILMFDFILSFIVDLILGFNIDQILRFNIDTTYGLDMSFFSFSY